MRQTVDYLPYYFGSLVLFPEKKFGTLLTPELYVSILRQNMKCKLLLRPWSTLDAEELLTAGISDQGSFWNRKKGKGKLTLEFETSHPGCLYPDEYHYLCTLGIDLFGLIVDGLAIDKTTTA